VKQLNETDYEILLAHLEIGLEGIPQIEYELQRT